MKLRSVVVSFTDGEILELLKKLDLPLSVTGIRSADGRMFVQAKKGLHFKFSIVFTSDGRHLSATVDAGVLGNPITEKILASLGNNGSEWGVSHCGRTVVFDPEKALANAGITGDLRVDKTAVGAGELVFSLEGDLPLNQFVKTTLP